MKTPTFNEFSEIGWVVCLVMEVIILWMLTHSVLVIVTFMVGVALSFISGARLALRVSERDGDGSKVIDVDQK